MNREIIEWCDEKFEGLNDETGKPVKKHWMLKSFGLGAIEGILDGLTIIGAYTIVGLGILVMTSKFKKD